MRNKGLDKESQTTRGFIKHLICKILQEERVACPLTLKSQICGLKPAEEHQSYKSLIKTFQQPFD